MNYVWVVLAEGKQFGRELHVYDDPVRALDYARGIVRAALERYHLDRPDDLQAVPNFLAAAYPYWARIVDCVEVSVERCEVRRD